ncbi:MAG TPA: TSUP family transporter, partial [Pseudorhizobium sp.]|nr:TSUP family transporter [Pseudorhizobium sp.]
MPLDPVYLLIIGALAGIGMVAGLLAGLLGVGGGIAIVPLFSGGLGIAGLIPDIASHLAVGTSLATIIPTSISSMRAHNRRGNVDRS